MNKPKRLKVQVTLEGLLPRSRKHHTATDDVIAKLRAAATRIQSYQDRGYRLQYVQKNDSPGLIFALALPLPEDALRTLQYKLDLTVDSNGYGFYFRTTTKRILLAAGIKTIRDLVQRTEKDMMFGERRVPGLGPALMADIRDNLDRLDLKLGMNTNELEGKTLVMPER